MAEANRYYALASTTLDSLAADAYGDVVRRGVAAGQARIAQAEQE